MEALAAMERGSASPGDVAAAEWGARRLAEAGARDVRVERFRYQRTIAERSVPHLAAGIAAARAGGVAGAAVALASLVSFELDFGGRSQWLRRLVPAGEGANAVARVPAAGESSRTLVLVAHHDTAHTGIGWRNPELIGIGTGDRLRELTGREPEPDVMDSPATAPKLAFAAVAAGSLLRARALRAAGGASLAVALAMALDVARSPSVPGASDNATGVAAVLAMVERFAAEPLPGTDVIAVLTGCEESGMGGMAHWLRGDGGRLDPSSTLVLGLDTLGAGEPIVARAEGSIRPWRYRDEDLDIADRGAARAGIEPPRRVQLGGWTDPLLAVHAGLPTISLLSATGNRFTNYHQPTDTPDRVDWDSVAACLRCAYGTVEEWAAG
ncbi:MAG TPA: M20/M25/M40 family metallo-hydrolase [Thermoleophilaceae bacterium]